MKQNAKDASENAALYKVGHKCPERNLPNSIADIRQRLMILPFERRYQRTGGEEAAALDPDCSTGGLAPSPGFTGAPLK